MQTVVSFMQGLGGRILRVALGLALIYVGFVTLESSTAGTIVALIGVVPIIMGLWGRSLLGIVYRPKR